MDQQLRGTRRFPVADRPVELLLLVPADVGIAVERDEVVADRAVDRVLEIGMPGFGALSIRLREW